MLIKCQKCNYQWNYNGKARYATCPRCLSKVRVEQQDKITIQCLLCNSKLKTENNLEKIYKAGWAECIVITADLEIQGFLCPKCLNKLHTP